MNRAGSILEIIWLVMGGLLLFIGIGDCVDNGLKEGWPYLVFAVVALFMYLRRRKLRISGK